MEKVQSYRWWKLMAMFLTVVLLVSVVSACDDNDDDDKATSPATTVMPAGTATGQSAETVSDKPVKMGICMATSGSMAMAGLVGKQVVGMVEKMVKENGGIQVGNVKRPVDFIWYDDKGEISGTVAGWKKLVDQDHISIMAMGGIAGAQCTEMSAQATEYKVPYVNYAPTPIELTDYPYASRVVMKNETSVVPVVNLLLDLKPKTVALLGDEEKNDRDFFDRLRSLAIDPLGAKVVYEEYVTLGISDYAPYLTRIIHEEPDVLVHYSANFQAFGNVYKSIGGLGGWRDMTYIGAMSPANMWQQESSAVGTYQWMLWAPILDNPGTQEYLQACEKYGVKVDVNHINMWNALWTAIHAVEQAGSDDPETINQTLRSGEFQWEAPTGLLRIDTDGEPGIPGFMVQIGEGGQLNLIK